MDVESGEGGDASPAVEKSAGDVPPPPEVMIFNDLFFLDSDIKIVLFQHFQIK